MRKLFVILTFFSIINCKENPSSFIEKEKFFDYQKLPLLSLEEVNTFWHDDSIKDTSDFIDGTFNDHSGFLGGLSYRGDKKGVGVSVFKSQTVAIEAMELRRNNVATIIKLGTSNEALKGKWWFADNIPSMVFYNQWNTIIEVYYYSDYKEVETVLMETTAEIARRIDLLSN